MVEALQALRGIGLVATATIMVEASNQGRFKIARQFMRYLELIPGERSTGTTVCRLENTKEGDGPRWPALVESAWIYRHPPRAGKLEHYVLEKLPAADRLAARDPAHGTTAPVGVSVGAVLLVQAPCDRASGQRRPGLEG